jgi:hypothetical protein
MLTNFEELRRMHIEQMKTWSESSPDRSAVWLGR